MVFSLLKSVHLGKLATCVPKLVQDYVCVYEHMRSCVLLSYCMYSSVFLHVQYILHAGQMAAAWVWSAETWTLFSWSPVQTQQIPWDLQGPDLVWGQHMSVLAQTHTEQMRYSNLGENSSSEKCLSLSKKWCHSYWGGSRGKMTRQQIY